MIIGKASQVQTSKGPNGKQETVPQRRSAGDLGLGGECGPVGPQLPGARAPAAPRPRDCRAGVANAAAATVGLGAWSPERADLSSAHPRRAHHGGESGRRGRPVGGLGGDPPAAAPGPAGCPPPLPEGW